jgi:DNA polymerase I-like protein with 3'-5' exonuclease and polymerase domains/uracil-DNA glycosylase
MRPTGPIPAEIMIVGEAPGFEEERYGVPFIGASGRFLDDELRAVGLVRGSCFVTNVCRHRPPKNLKTGNPNDIGLWVSGNVNPPKNGDWVRLNDRWVHPHVRDGYALLYKELELVKPKLILALGNIALWALTGNEGIAKWHGSRLSPPHLSATVVPLLHPAAILRQAEQHFVFRMGIQRAADIYTGKQVPRAYNFLIAPTLREALEQLNSVLFEADLAWAEGYDYPLVGDLETRSGHVTCLGFARSFTRAFCIPYLTANKENPYYWSVEEEAILLEVIHRIFDHPAILHIGQNYLYDLQYFGRRMLKKPRRVFDTMIAHHSIFGSIRKGLDFLSLMYCADHVYWKDESKDWDPKVGEKQLWTYNCKDNCATLEAYHGILLQKKATGVDEHFHFQQSLFFPVLRMMERGVRWDLEARRKVRTQLHAALEKRRSDITYMAGESLFGPKGISAQKSMEFFYDTLRMPGVKSLKTGNPTADSDALEVICTREPLLRPICVAINEARSLTTFLGTFIEARVDEDQRMRSTFNIAGPVTYRFSSNENAFGSGFNFQNLPTEKSGKKKVRGAWKEDGLPNVRTLAIPDPGMEFFDIDLDRADLQVVAWEADDTDLKKALRMGVDLHCFNAIDLFDIKGVPVDEIVETHPNYRDRRKQVGELFRQRAKQGAHAVDYGVGARKLAILLGITIHEAERFIAKWFGAHPGIKKWHERTEAEYRRCGFTANRFGARLYQFGHFDLPEALGWLPQSTVAGVINRILVAVDAEEQAGKTRIQLLLQVHDSLAGQFPFEERRESIATLERLGKIVVPYEDPLVIPVGIQTSVRSWGDCNSDWEKELGQ